MTHKNDQEMIFNILKNIDYSKEWKEINYELGYTLGDYSFENPDTYTIVRQSAKNLWVILNGHLNQDGNAL